MSLSYLAQTIAARFPNSLRSWEPGGQPDHLSLSSAHLVEIGEWIRDEPAARYDLFLALAPLGDELVYQLVSHSRAQRLQLHVPLHERHDSVSLLWPAANWAEREAHELWDIDFAGHPNLDPLLRIPSPPLPLPPANPNRLIGGTRYPTSLDGLVVDLDLDGGRVAAAYPRLGLRHCGLGQRLAHLPYPEGLALAARIDSFAAAAADLAYALALEQLIGVEPPPRAQALRALYAELGRIASHLYWLAGCTQNLAGPSSRLPAQAWQGRAEILKWMGVAGGNPIAPTLVAVGGLQCDAPPAFLAQLPALLGRLFALQDRLEGAVLHRGGLAGGLHGVGIIDPGTALGLGMTGPNLRACGVGYDVRTAFPYAAYGALDIEPVLAQGGDAQARCHVRLTEMGASLRIVQELFERLPDGPINAFAPSPPPVSLPAGIAYASVEGPRGELGMMVTADGTPSPCQVYTRGPSFANLSALPFMMPGTPREQAVLVLDSLDISLAEVER